MGLIQITAPTDTPVSLAEAKTQLRIDHSDDDTYITHLIDVVASKFEPPHGRLNRSLCSQTLEASLPAWPCDRIVRLIGRPVTAVSSVKYSDEDNVEATLSSGNYYLLSDQAGLGFLTDADLPCLYPRPDAIRIRYVAGHADAANIPERIRHAILAVVTRLYAQRGDMVPGSLREDQEADRLIAPFVSYTA